MSFPDFSFNSLASIVFDEKSAVNYIVVLLYHSGTSCFSLTDFNKFLLIFGFQHFDEWCMNLFYVVFIELLRSLDQGSSSNLGSFQPSFWHFQYAYVVYLMVSHLSEAVIFFFILSFSFCPLDHLVSIHLLPRLLTLPSACSNLLLSHSSGFFISVTILSNSRISTWFFFALSLYLLIFSI